MKKRTIKAVLILLAMIVSAITVYPYFKKTYLKYELIYAYPEGGGPYRYDYGMDYEFYHNKQSMERSHFIHYFIEHVLPKGPEQHHSDNNEQAASTFFNALDFDQYSYVAFNAPKVTSMY